MIYIVTAMYAEAHAFINRFQLKKDTSHTRFQVFLNKEVDLCLIISGTGSVPAAAAVSSICTEYGAGQGDFLINVGVCAQIRNETIPRPKNLCQMGTIFLCSKITEHATGKTFYPDLLYRHRFAEAQIITGAKPYTNSCPVTAYSLYDQFSQSSFLYDMEAAAVYQAGAYYFGPHQMSFLKIISDDGNTASVTPKQIEGLMESNMESIADYLLTLQIAAREERQENPFWDSTLQKELEQLCLDLHCSRTMSESVRQHIRYCILSGVDYVSVLEEMYRDETLPCKDKWEGKQCIEKLKKRLL